MICNLSAGYETSSCITHVQIGHQIKLSQPQLEPGLPLIPDPNPAPNPKPTPNPQPSVPALVSSCHRVRHTARYTLQS